jgi:hypothetical protein
VGILVLRAQEFLLRRGPDKSGHVRVLSGDPNGNKVSTSSNKSSGKDQPSECPVVSGM